MKAAKAKAKVAVKSKAKAKAKAGAPGWQLGGTTSVYSHKLAWYTQKHVKNPWGIPKKMICEPYGFWYYMEGEDEKS